MSVDKKYIPFDKSWIIRMGFLDILYEYKDIDKFLSKNNKLLGGDLLALKKISQNWNKSKVIDVGESGTIYRLFKFASWEEGLNKKFVLRGTLKVRKIVNDPKIINFSQKKLLKLDNGTSQWATAKVLMGDKERLKNPPFKLSLTYKAVDVWYKARKQGKMWPVKYDDTILNQAEAYLLIKSGRKPKWKPEQAEDYCFAYVFGYITEREGEKRWPALKGHESNRFLEAKETLDRAILGKKILSKDHRIVQAISMWAKINKVNINVKYPKSVNKSWPQFWDFIKKY